MKASNISSTDLSAEPMSSRPTTMPTERLSLFVYIKPPPSRPSVISPNVSHAMPSSLDNIRRFSRSSFLNLYTSFTPTAIVLGSVGPVRPASSRSTVLEPSAMITSLAYTSSSWQRTPTTRRFLPSPSVISSVTCTLETSKAPFFSASSASHLSNLARNTT